ncbi:MAG: hypothetical protein Q4D02_03290 [Clostridia bacterium]|nr:hypothetical protein [Clostridia bacterium]
MDEEKKDDFNSINYTDYKAIWGFGEDHIDIFGDDEDQEEVKPNELDDEYKIFLCLNCRYILDETKEPHKPRLKELLEKDGKCPKCGKPILGNYLVISREKMKREIAAQKRKEYMKKKKEEWELEDAREDIKDDCMDLLYDLRDRLLDGKITPERFVVLYLNLSYRIVNHYGKKLPIYASEYRKTFLSLCDDVLKYYHAVDESKIILEDYDEAITSDMSAAEKLSLSYKGDIEKDKLFIAESKFYFEDDKFAIPAYEMEERIEEYNKLQDEINREQREKELEEKYQERVTLYAKKLQDRSLRRQERKLDFD